ncbi:putative proton-dependent oligopeptide transporter family [Helianthus anomalus]
MIFLWLTSVVPQLTPSCDGLDTSCNPPFVWFLNKACVLRDFNPNSSKLDRWSLLTVEKVESLKSLIRVLPLWSTGILIFTTMPPTFPTLQAKTKIRHVTS